MKWTLFHFSELPSTAASLLRKQKFWPGRDAAWSDGCSFSAGVASLACIHWFCLSGISHVNCPLRSSPIGSCSRPRHWCHMLHYTGLVGGALSFWLLLCWDQFSPVTLMPWAELWSPAQTPFSLVNFVGVLDFFSGHRLQSIPHPTSAGFSEFQNREARA